MVLTQEQKSEYHSSVEKVLLDAGLNDLHEDPDNIEHVLNSFEILVATTCKACKDGKPPGKQ